MGEARLETFLASACLCLELQNLNYYPYLKRNLARVERLRRSGNPRDALPDAAQAPREPELLPIITYEPVSSKRKLPLNSQLGPSEARYKRMRLPAPPGQDPQSILVEAPPGFKAVLFVPEQSDATWQRSAYNDKGPSNPETRLNKDVEYLFVTGNPRHVLQHHQPACFLCDHLNFENHEKLLSHLRARHYLFTYERREVHWKRSAIVQITVRPRPSAKQKPAQKANFSFVSQSISPSSLPLSFSAKAKYLLSKFDRVTEPRVLNFQELSFVIDPGSGPGSSSQTRPAHTRILTDHPPNRQMHYDLQWPIAPTLPIYPIASLPRNGYDAVTLGGNIGHFAYRVNGDYSNYSQEMLPGTGRPSAHFSNPNVDGIEVLGSESIYRGSNYEIVNGIAPAVLPPAELLAPPPLGPDQPLRNGPLQPNFVQNGHVLNPATDSHTNGSHELNPAAAVRPVRLIAARPPPNMAETGKQITTKDASLTTQNLPLGDAAQVIATPPMAKGTQIDGFTVSKISSRTLQPLTSVESPEQAIERGAELYSTTASNLVNQAVAMNQSRNAHRVNGTSPSNSPTKKPASTRLIPKNSSDSTRNATANHTETPAKSAVATDGDPIVRHIRKKYPVPPSPGDGRHYFRSVSKRILEEGEMLSESDDEVDQTWLLQKQRERILTNSALLAAQREFMLHYDIHMLRADLQGLRYVPDELKRFIEANKDWLRDDEEMREELCDKLHHLQQEGTITEGGMLDCLAFMRRCTDGSNNSKSLRHTSGESRNRNWNSVAIERSKV